MLKYDLPVGGEVFLLCKEFALEGIRSDKGGNEAGKAKYYKEVPKCE